MSEIPQSQRANVCFACKAIELEYAQATAEHLQLQLDLYMMTASRDCVRQDQLCEQLLKAELRRKAAKLLVCHH